MIVAFPPHDTADDDGFLATGGDLEVDSLLLAYRSGIFPWPFNSKTLAWFSPPQRAILFFDRLHLSHSLKKARRQTTCEFSLNRDFEQVIDSCAKAKNRKNQRGTWITPAMIAAYKELHRSGYAHSFECWNGSKLVGGMYGVKIDRLFAGESMFHIENNCSKMTLCYAVEQLNQQGLTWMDCQVINPLTESLGAIEVPRERYLQMLSASLGQSE